MIQRHEFAVADRVDRGDLTGRRVETVPYVCERPGAYALPALALAWWNPEEQALSRERLPGRTFAVTAPPAPPPAAPAPAPPHGSRAPAVIATALVVATAFAWWLAPALRTRWQTFRATVAASEGAAFAAFHRACATGDARAANRALTAWLDRFPIDDSVPTVASVAARAGDPELTAQLAALQSAALGPKPSPWSPHDLARCVAAARSRLARRPRRRVDVLPPLNPSG